jgi:hypothetical protein
VSEAPHLRACIIVTGEERQEVTFLYPPARFVQFALLDPVGARGALQAMNEEDQARQLRACLRWASWYGWRFDTDPAQLQALLLDKS